MPERKSIYKVIIDATGAKAGADSVSSAFEKMRSRSDKTNRNFQSDFNKFSDNASKSFKSVSKNFASMAASMTTKIGGFAMMAAGTLAKFGRGAWDGLKSGFKAAMGFIFSKLKGAAAELSAMFGTAFSIKAIVDTGVEMQKFESTLSVATGSIAAAQAEISGLLALTKEFGVSFSGSILPFAKLFASASGTLQAPDVREVFKSFTEASAALRLGKQEIFGVFLALQQIASKGIVSMEELRLQLAERIPKAMQSAAKSMGMSMGDFEKAVQNRLIPSGLFLRRFAKQMHEDFGPAAKIAAGMAQASFERLATAIFELKARISNSGFLDAFADMIDRITYWVQSNPRVFDEIGKGLAQVISDITDLLYKVDAVDIETFFMKMKSMVSSMYSSMKNELNFMSEGLGNWAKTRLMDVGRLMAEGVVEGFKASLKAALFVSPVKRVSDALEEAAGKRARNGSAVAGPGHSNFGHVDFTEGAMLTGGYTPPKATFGNYKDRWQSHEEFSNRVYSSEELQWQSDQYKRQTDEQMAKEYRDRYAGTMSDFEKFKISGSRSKEQIMHDTQAQFDAIYSQATGEKYIVQPENEQDEWNMKVESANLLKSAWTAAQKAKTAYYKSLETPEKKALDSLQSQVDVIGLNKYQLMEYKVEQAGVVRGTEEWAEATKKIGLIEAFDKQERIAKEVQKIREGNASIMDEHLIKMQRLNDLREQGYLLEIEYDEARKRAKEDLAQATGKLSLDPADDGFMSYTEELGTKFDSISKAAEACAQTVESSLGAGLHSALKSDFEGIGDAFVSMADNILKTFTDMIAEMVMRWAMADLFGFALGGVSGGGAAVSSASGAMYTPGLSGTGRSHGGSIASDERLAVIQSGQRVLSRTDTKDYDSGTGSGLSIVQHINVDATNSNITEAQIEQAVESGSERGYEKVFRDADRGGPISTRLRG